MLLTANSRLLWHVRGNYRGSEPRRYIEKQSLVTSRIVVLSSSLMAFGKVRAGASDVGVENFREVAELQAEEVRTLTNAVNISNDLFRSIYATYLEVITAQRNVLEGRLRIEI